MNNILSVETIYDETSKNTYVITLYENNSYVVKVYKKDIDNNCYHFLGTFHFDNNSILSL